MGYLNITSHASPPAKRGREIHFLAIGLILAFLFYRIYPTYALHQHHSDEGIQEDCTICMVVLHQSGNISIGATVLLGLVFLFFLSRVQGSTALFLQPFSTREVRAPTCKLF